tara:strand:+ start:885 stop:1040 length:156 start_codon:yes stop_codon:yes gene_type:complete
MNKMLPLVLAIPFTTTPVFAWGEDGCFFSNKNKASQDETIEQLDSYFSSDR